MPSSKTKNLPTPMKPLDQKTLQFSLAKKLAAMDPREREQLLRLERLRRGLPVTVVKPKP